MSRPRYSIDWIATKLPPVEKAWRRSEPDFYGASYLIAKKLGKNRPPVSFAFWRHGWSYVNSPQHPKLLTSGGPHDINLVAHQAHATLLKQWGYRFVEPVGLPFGYSESRHNERMPGSLLVMPGHTLAYTDHSWDQKRYVEQISSLKPHFRQIIACINSNCIKKGYWITDFEKNEIPWIPGADSFDRNSLVRLKTLFNSFEFMTTNTIGSHVVYAASSGCKPSIYGDYGAYRREDFVNDPFYINHHEVLEQVLAKSSEETIRQQFPWLFTHPAEAASCQDWGKEMIGESFLRSSSEIAVLLGWTPRKQISGYLKESRRLLRDLPALLRLISRYRG